jgi:hypothetical protein
MMPMENKGEPFPISSNLLMFHDWRYIHPSYPGWELPPEFEALVKEEGKQPGTYLALNSGEKMPESPLVWKPKDMPRGIRIEAKRPQLEPRQGPSGPIIFENGVYRMWYTKPASPVVGKEYSDHYVLCYAESHNGTDWNFPSLDIVNLPGLDDRNIVHVSPYNIHGVSVFRDPSAPAEERYKAFYLGLFTPEAEERYCRNRPSDLDPMCYRKGVVWGVFGSVSPDGLHWTALPDALVMQQNDTYQDCYYDPILKKYVAHFRMRYCHRRAIGRSETDDFRHFPPPQLSIWCDANTSPSEEWYGPFGRSCYPGTADYHFMFPLLWKVDEDLFYTHMAVSPEGKYWSILSPGPVMSPDKFGTPDAGGLVATSGLVELPNNRVGLLVDGYSMPHKYPFRPSHPPGGRYWATWPKERLVALVVDEYGEFRTRLLAFDGNEIRINARTRYTGSIRIQVTDINDQPLPGKAFDDCDPITGDCLNRPVTWNGRSPIGRAPDQPVKLWFRLHAAELFALYFKPAMKEP